MSCTVVPFGDYQALEDAVQPNTRFIFSESPTNPYLNIFDLVRLGEIARRHKVLTVIDSTFAIRVGKQNETAMKAARFLEAHPRVRRVYCPGLESHRHHRIADLDQALKKGVQRRQRSR